MRRIPEKNQLLKDPRGFTLVEAMVTVIIFTFILGICYTLLISGSDSWETNSARVELQQELRKAMDWIAQDLRQAGSASITNVPADGATYTSITFRKSAGASGGNLVWDSNTTTYSLGGTGGTQLLRQVSGQTASVIAQDIQSLQFSRQASTANVVDVSLQAQKTTLRGKTLAGKTPIQASLILKIYLRN
ncbi:MAG: prepilin-type N-terminal cleavage/methylation domain-containing protein [Candidatus Omnitrophica bacterium]|nr:prepilin-type N-terminal cleavage/methylation domain-containing protein [Candidatus Omnitrophota bacterium]